MSKSSTATTVKSPPQLPSKSAWAKGPPQTNSSTPTPRSQSPANVSNPPHLTHSRRSSNLGPIKDAVSMPRSNVGSVKQGSAVTFGSIDDPSAPLSSSPATKSSPVKSDGVTPPSPVPATTSGHVNGRSSTSPASASSKPPVAPSTSSTASATSPTPSTTAPTPLGRMDIKKLFQVAPPNQAPDSTSPSVRQLSLPPQPQPPSSAPLQQSQPIPPTSQPSPLSSHYTPFVPVDLRPQQQNGPGVGPGPGQRSPVYSRQMTNGTVPRPSAGPNGPGSAPPPMSAGLSSPRLAPHPHPPQPPAMSPAPGVVPVPGWPGYFYPDPYMPYSPGWYPPQPLPHQPQHPHHLHHHPPPPGGPPGPPHAGMPMSPRHPPPPLQAPSTPTQPHSHASQIPHSTPATHPTPPSVNNIVAGISSPPATPSTTGSSLPPTGGRLNTNASTFVPNRNNRPLSKVTVKNSEGREVDLESLSKSAGQQQQQPSGPSGMASNVNRRSIPVRLESEEVRKRRLALELDKEREKLEAEEKAKREKEELARKEEEEETKRKEAEEEERRRKEEELEKERIRKEEEERERIRKEEEEKERIRKEQEEKERLLKEEKERKRKAEEEERERQRVRKEQEERERVKIEEEKERIKREEEEKDRAAATQAEEGTLTPTANQAEDGKIEVPVEEAEEAPKDERSKEPLRIDTISVKTPPPPLDIPRKRPGPLDLTYANKTTVAAPLPSALATARVIDDLARVPYPEGVSSPKVELNINAKDGKFRYDRDFLLQFMMICKEKPDMLPPLDAIGLEPVEQTFPSMTRGGSGRHRQSSNPAPSSSSRQAPIGLGITASGFAKANASSQFNMGMGNFSTMPTKLTSDERFAMANSSRVASGPAGLQFRPVPMVRSNSQGGPGAPPGSSTSSHRTRSKRGEKRNESNKIGGGGGPGGPQGHGSNFGAPGSIGPGGMLDPEPLVHSGNRWVPVSISRKPVAVDPDSTEIVDRKVRSLLNKLSMEKFDSISDQIIAWANKSEKEKNGRTLIQVIRLVFEKATDEATWSEMYARLCRKMMEQISPNVQDDEIKNAEGKPITGGQLFRKYLLNRCQEDFERGWVAKETTAAAAATKAIEDQAAAAKAFNNKGGNEEEIVLYSEEYYAAQKAKRQGLGLIKFIGELFKLQMLTERIMHECVKKLLGNVDNPEEEEIENLCKLLATVGALLDTTKARAHMDIYFSRMKESVKSPNVSARMQFMLQDVIELRERKWVSRNAVAAPATIAQIHEAAAKEKAAQEKESYQRQMSMSRGGSRRGGERGEISQPAADGWTVASGSGGPSRPPTKAGDLSNFGKIAKSTPTTFGPSGIFAGKKDNAKKESLSLSRSSSNSNMFSMLSQNPEGATDAGTAGSSRHNHLPRKTSVDISHVAPEPPAQRKKLVLQPRSKILEGPSVVAPRPSSESSSDNDEPEVPAESRMPEAEATKKIAEDSKEFFAVRNLDEAEEYFSNLPVYHRFRLVDKLVAKAIESKESDAQLVAEFFSRAAEKELCSAESFEEGFMSTAEILDEIVFDAPKAFELMAVMLRGAGLDKDGERRTRIASKSKDSDKLLALLLP